MQALPPTGSPPSLMARADRLPVAINPESRKTAGSKTVWLTSTTAPKPNKYPTESAGSLTGLPAFPLDHPQATQRQSKTDDGSGGMVCLDPPAPRSVLLLLLEFLPKTFREG